MAVTLDLSDDYLIWDNRETITYTAEKRSGDSAYVIDDCKRRALTYRELAFSGGAYTSGDRAWLIPTAVIPDGITPKIADRVTDDDGAVWTVLEAALNTYQSWWRLLTRNIVLAADLREVVTLSSPSTAQDAAGGRTPVYSTAVADLPAKILEGEVTSEDQLGKRQAVRRFTAWVGQRVYPAADWRLTDSAGVVYQITGWRAADRHDVLQELDLEIVK